MATLRAIPAADTLFSFGPDVLDNNEIKWPRRLNKERRALKDFLQWAVKGVLS